MIALGSRRKNYKDAQIKSVWKKKNRLSVWKFPSNRKGATFNFKSYVALSGKNKRRAIRRNLAWRAW